MKETATDAARSAERSESTYFMSRRITSPRARFTRCDILSVSEFIRNETRQASLIRPKFPKNLMTSCLLNTKERERERATDDGEIIVGRCETSFPGAARRVSVFNYPSHARTVSGAGAPRPWSKFN